MRRWPPRRCPLSSQVPLPFFLRNATIGLGWSRPLTGLFLAVWIIVYGQVHGDVMPWDLVYGQVHAPGRGDAPMSSEATCGKGQSPAVTQEPRAGAARAHSQA